MIAFQDFKPQLIEIRFPNDTWETSQEVITRMNRWIEQSGVVIISIETLIVSANHREQQIDESPLVMLPSIKGLQLFRVWYRDEHQEPYPVAGQTERLTST